MIPSKKRNPLERNSYRHRAFFWRSNGKTTIQSKKGFLFRHYIVGSSHDY